jgi:DNA-binding beta-propeller fold protein YncE
MRPVVALLAAALLAGCTAREHANPFDPLNPVTHGRPADFAALAQHGLVELRWSQPLIDGDFGYRLFRRVAGEADFTLLADLGARATEYPDGGVTDGVLHEYRLYYLFSGAQGGLPAEDGATPGPLRPWVADLSRRSLIGITPDGRHILSEIPGFVGPTHVAVDPASGLVWVSDTYEGRVLIMDPPGRTVPISGLTEPVAIAIDPANQSGWVCDQGRNTVFHFAPTGFAFPPITGVQTPIGIACDPVRDALWVCERGADRVRRFTRAGAPLTSTTLAAPSRVAVDSISGDAWVTCFDGRRVVRFAAAGAAADTVALSGPIGVAVDPRRGRIWIADALGSRVVALHRSGVLEFQVGGLPQAREIAVDPATGEAWVTVPGLAAVVRISAGGAVLGRLGGFRDPYGIALDPGR